MIFSSAQTQKLDQKVIGPGQCSESRKMFVIVVVVVCTCSAVVFNHHTIVDFIKKTHFYCKLWCCCV